MPFDERTLAAMRRMANAGASSELLAQRFDASAYDVSVAVGRCLPHDLPPVIKDDDYRVCIPVDPCFCSDLVDEAMRDQGSEWSGGFATLPH